MKKLLLSIACLVLVSGGQAMQQPESKAQAENAQNPDLSASLLGFRKKSVIGKAKDQQNLAPEDSQVVKSQVKLAESLQSIQAGKKFDDVQAGLAGFGIGKQSPQEVIKTSLEYQNKDVTEANRSDFEAIIGQLQLLEVTNQKEDIQRFCKAQIPVLQGKLAASKKS
jgi:hypothetical protein